MFKILLISVVICLVKCYFTKYATRLANMSHQLYYEVHKKSSVSSLKIDLLDMIYMIKQNPPSPFSSALSIFILSITINLNIHINKFGLQSRCSVYYNITLHNITFKKNSYL